MATPHQLFSSDEVTPGSADGAPAFLGSVYYVGDPRTGAPIANWPPKLPTKGFRGLAGFKSGGESGNGQRGAAIAALFGGKLKDLGRYLPLGGVGSDAPGAAAPFSSTASTIATATSTALVDDAAAAAMRDGPSVYFTSRVMAERMRDFIRRPLGLFHFSRRRLWRPSDIPLAPVSVDTCPMGEAYGKLCVGWGNPALAAQLGFSADPEQKMSASVIIDTWDDEDEQDTAVAEGDGASGGGGGGGAVRRGVVCDGVAKNLVPVLTGFRLPDVGGDQAAAGAGRMDHEKKKKVEEENAFEHPMRARTWVRREIMKFVFKNVSNDSPTTVGRMARTTRRATRGRMRRTIVVAPAAAAITTITTTYSGRRRQRRRLGTTARLSKLRCRWPEASPAVP